MNRLVTLVIILIISCGVFSSTAGAANYKQLRRQINHYRELTWRYEDQRLGLIKVVDRSNPHRLIVTGNHKMEKYPRAHRTYGSDRYKHSRSIPYLTYIKKVWAKRAQKEWLLAKKYKDPFAAIRYVFGPYYSQARTVALCEGGEPVPATYAHNGQYLGFFQMGDSERDEFGFAQTPLGQARAAFRMFVNGGHSWGRWECKPW